jgi:hypothetical protein
MFNGTAILFYKSVDVKFCHHDAGGRYSRVDYLWSEGELFSLVCIYAPANHTDRKSFFADTMLPYLQKHPPSDNCFIGEDFNFVDSPTLDRSRVSASCIAGLIEWSETAESINLFDVFRNFHPQTRFFTYRCASSFTQSRVLSNECETFLKSNVDKTLTEDFRLLCDRPVSLAELDHALRKLPKGKVPGIDGLPAEFFRYFWTGLKESFMDVVQILLILVTFLIQ